MFIPNWVNVFGSNYIQLRETDARQSAQSFNDIIRPKEGKHYQQIMTITKSGLNALDKPSERCSANEMTPNTTACIVSHFEDQLGCSLNINGGGSNGLAPCPVKLGYNSMRNMTKLLNEAESNTIYSLTGCFASCRRFGYEQIDSSFKVLNKTRSVLSQLFGNSGNPKDIELELKFRIIKASYREEEQYIIYDFNSFIGDVGGFLGLLLGYSVLSLYGDIARVLGRFKRSLPK